MVSTKMKKKALIFISIAIVGALILPGRLLAEYVWTQHLVPGGVDNLNALSAAVSSDGTIIYVATNGYINFSNNSGAAWSGLISAGNHFWDDIACSSDGSKVVAIDSNKVVYYSSDYGATWTQREDGTLYLGPIKMSSDGTKLVAYSGAEGYIYTSQDSGATWIQRTAAPQYGGYDIAISSDGTKILIICGDGYLYTSTNFGASWTQRASAESRSWEAVASSSDGTKLAAVVYNGATAGGYIYTSSDSGATWTEQINSGERYWKSIASSSDGVNLVAVDDNDSSGGYVYTSADSGATWTARTGAGSRRWEAVASSGDGAVISALDGSGYIYVSANSGADWTANNGIGGGYSLRLVASSSDGVKLAVASSSGDYIFTSADSGSTWLKRTGAGARDWEDLAMSSDGTKLAAVPNGGYIYTSADSGANWSQRTGAGSRQWDKVSISDDGSKLVAGAYSGYLYASTDSGATWNVRTGPGAHEWYSIVASSDGVKVAASGDNDYIFVSEDSGATWTERTSLGYFYGSQLVMTADGSKLYATGGYWDEINEIDIICIYSSTDLGVTWSVISGSCSMTQYDFYAFAMSADETRMVVSAEETLYHPEIFSSADSGQTWEKETDLAGIDFYSEVALSADGSKVLTTDPGSGVYWNSYVYTGVLPTNAAPEFSAGPADNATSTAPVDVGDNVTFTATATDTDEDNYYLAICKTDSITAGNEAAPTCGGGEWCVSDSTVSGEQATCSYTAQAGDDESNEWFAFVCDHNTSGECSEASQGTANASPFNINHAPSFASVAGTSGAVGLGANATFTASASDNDSDGTADTVALYVCKSNDFDGLTCGIAGEWCHSSLSASNPTCSHTVVEGDGTGTQNYYAYIIDSHGFQSVSNPRSSTFTTDIDASSITGLTNDTTPRKTKTWTWTGEEGDTFRFVIDQLVDTDPTGAYASTTEATQALGNGTYYLHVQSKDAANNESETVTVSAILDNTAPTITITGDNPVTRAQYSSYTDAGATAEDNIDETVTVDSESNVNTDVVGDYTVTYTATDTAGNEAEPAVRTVHVTDQAASDISGLTNDTTPRKTKTWTWTGEEGDTFRFVIDQLVDTDPTGDYSDETTATKSSGNGTWYLHVQSKDAANNESETVTVSAILDNTAPTITITGNNTVAVRKGSSYNDDGATAADNIDDTITVHTDSNVDTDTVGDYTVTYTATDTAGNEAAPVTRAVEVTKGSTSYPGQFAPGAIVFNAGQNSSLLAQIEYLKSEIARLTALLAQQGASNTGQTCKLTRDLYFGLMADSEVRCLQAFLKTQGTGIYPSGMVTGNYLALTRAAVMRFQSVNGLNVTGIVDEVMRQKINISLGK